LGQQGAEVAVGAITGGKPVQGETVQTNLGGQPHVAGNGCRVVGVIGLQRLVTGADIAGVPTIAIVPGKVMGQHQPRFAGEGDRGTAKFWPDVDGQ